MSYVRKVTKLTCIVVCVYTSSLTRFAYFLSLFEPISFFYLNHPLLSGLDFAATCVCATSYSYADADAGYTFYPLSYL